MYLLRPSENLRLRRNKALIIAIKPNKATNFAATKEKRKKESKNPPVINKRIKVKRLYFLNIFLRT